MEKKIKRVRIVGKGHASCFERLLLEWYRRESFADVIFTCVGTPENYLDDRESFRNITANRTILAAASPIFAALFRECLLVEEDVRISVVGYSYNSLRSVVEYIYTGTLEFSERDKVHVEKLLRDFCIRDPNKKNASNDYEKVVRTENATANESSSVDKSDGLGIKILSSVSLSDQIPTQTQRPNKPRLLAPKLPMPVMQTSVTPQIYNTTGKSVLLSDEVEVPTETQRPNKLRLLAPKLPMPLTQTSVTPQVYNTTGKSVSLLDVSDEVATKTQRPNKLRMLAPKLPMPVTQTNVTPQVCNTTGNTAIKEKNIHLWIQTGGERHAVLENRTASISNSRNASLTRTPEATVTHLEQSTSFQQSLIRVLHRNIDAPQSQNKRILDPPSIHFAQTGLIKSFAEKSVIQPRSVFLPPTVVHIPLLKNSNSVDETARIAHYRKILSGFYDVPGAYTLYKERSMPSIVDSSFSEPAEISVMGHIFVPSYFEKKPVRTYQERPTERVTGRSSQGNITLSGIRIDSIHQVNGKVHICTMGELVVNKESETLFEDHPLSYLSPDQMISRLSVEHNYSFGETPGPVDNECSNRNELATDMEDLNRAVQLVIAEQRRKNRMKYRIQSYTEEIDTLKRRATQLLDICQSMRDEAHEIDPDYQRPKKKQATERPIPSSPNKDLEQKVPCTVCNKLVKKSWLKRHMIILHTEERNHLCDECGRTFVLKGQLRAHQLRQHKAVPGNHLCEQCGRSFRFARYLNRHMSLHSSEKPHVCRYCDKAFRLKPVLIKHIRTHTGEKPYKCTVCGRCFRQRTTYATHLKVHEKRLGAGLVEGDGSRGSLPRLKCDFCSMTFKLDLFLMLHRAKHTGETPALPCPTCTETFPSIKELTLHRKSQHPESVYACQSCPKVFTNKANFDFHVHKHSNPDAVKKKYPKVAPVDTGPCTCDFCDKVFKSRSALDYHIKGIHLGDKPLKCQHCDKTFSHKPSMEQHMRTHTGERPYKCDQCSSAFKQQQHLTAHLVVHTGERPYSCEHCDKTFPHKTTLYAHLRIHTGKRLICTHCRKVMPSLAQLMRHEETCPLNTNESSVD